MTDKPPVSIEDLDPEQPWTRLQVENDLWYSRFLIYRDMGPVRSILGASKIEAERTHKEKPKGSPRNWREMAAVYRWDIRVKAWDEHKRKEVFTDGYAYDLVRIKKLNVIAQSLENRIHKGLLAEMKKDLKGLDKEYLELYLKILEALAKETGGRIQKREVAGPHGGALEVLLYLPEQEEDAPPVGDEETWE